MSVLLDDKRTRLRKPRLGACTHLSCLRGHDARDAPWDVRLVDRASHNCGFCSTWKKRLGITSRRMAGAERGLLDRWQGFAGSYLLDDAPRPDVQTQQLHRHCDKGSEVIDERLEGFLALRDPRIPNAPPTVDRTNLASDERCLSPPPHPPFVVIVSSTRQPAMRAHIKPFASSRCFLGTAKHRECLLHPP